MYYRGIKFTGFQYYRRSGWFRICFVGLAWIRLHDWEMENPGKYHTFDFQLGRYVFEFLTPDFN